MSRIFAREADPGEFGFLQAKLSQRRGWEQVRVRESVAAVAEDAGILIGMAAARPIWQIEPLILFPEFERYGLPMHRKAATYRLGEKIIQMLAGRDPGKIRHFLARIEDEHFAELAEKFGLRTIEYQGRLLQGGTDGRSG